MARGVTDHGGIGVCADHGGFNLIISGRVVGRISRVPELGAWTLALEGRSWTELPEGALPGVLRIGPGSPSLVVPFRDPRAAREYAVAELVRDPATEAGRGLPLFDAAGPSRR